MFRALPLALLILYSTLCFSQAARLVFNGSGAGAGQHPYWVFNPDPNPATNPGAYLVIANPNADGISYQGALTSNTPIIKSETEQNKIRWATGTATGIYMIPYSTGGWAPDAAMPLTVEITTAGAGGSDPSLVFSTYNSLGKTTGAPVASGWNNNNYRPSDVTHMNDQPTGSANNSSNAIDRFWIIDAGEGSYAYTTPPEVDITFGFDPRETNANGGNAAGLLASNNNLVAQRFNSGSGLWYDILPMGAQSGNTVAGVVPPTAGDLLRSWTLSNKNLPLPVQLVAWGGKCHGGVVELKWTTATEQDNAFFTIEKSRDAQDWSAIGTVPGAGNSSSLTGYAFADRDAQNLAYYRLRQTDINGTTTVSHTIAVGCGPGSGTAIVNAWDDGGHLNLVVSSTAEGLYDLVLMDAQGKVMATRTSQVIANGTTTLRMDTQHIATGIYMVQLYNNANSMSRRVHLE
ncbi:MAG: T9SS type A sorting domain-containing protein [Flavobacteriales bacterium]|nr:T9SS type A sorting domain-containing protein [Flavobacteriales bacterium]MBP9080339.1 T9SS type A sorting domain-containing protein [Flavobacteriales bacterium]